MWRRGVQESADQKWVQSGGVDASTADGSDDELSGLVGDFVQENRRPSRRGSIIEQVLGRKQIR